MAPESPASSRYNNQSTQTTPSPTVTSSSFARCPQCSQESPVKNGRNVVVCIDGTSNKFGRKNTNVVKLFSKIDLKTTDPEQCAYYSSGIGTRPKSLHVLHRMERAISDKFDMAIAWNKEEIVKDAYGWLAQTYQEGDQIYLFGFSRGAYQVRVLAGMIHEVGLIRTPTEKQIGTAYDHYEAVCSWKPKTRQMAKEFKDTFSWKDLGVHFIGIWDTVSSVGLIRGDVHLSTSSSVAHACHFRHALALDELRVKFMPEYLHEMNSQMYDSEDKYSRAGRRRGSTVIDNNDAFPEDTRHKTTEIKEVWFAGSHSDVGGMNAPGKSYHAGNVSLLWMRKEAADGGLVLKPTDVVWIPDDLDFGTSNPMSFWWKIIEYLPVTHQTSFSGAGRNTRRWHLSKPRRIIPGQKVHTSILYANAYKPLATLGEGFDIPITHTRPRDSDLESEIWETGLFDDTAAQELLAHFDDQQRITPAHLERLLFLLQFKEGKQCIRNVHGWKNLFKGVIKNTSKRTPLVRLVALVAYYEAACETTKGGKEVVPCTDEFNFDLDTINDAKIGLEDMLSQTEHKHRNHPRVTGILTGVVALLRSITKHQTLRRRIFTKEFMNRLVNLFDQIIGHPGGSNFGHAMDGLSYLLQCNGTRKDLIKNLKENLPDSEDNVSRLSRILQVNDPRHLTAALRLVLVFAKTPEGKYLFQKSVAARRKVRIATNLAKFAEKEEKRIAARSEAADPERHRAADATRKAKEAEEEAHKAAEADSQFWSPLRDRIRQLAERDEGLVGRLAVQILLELYDENDKHYLNIQNSRCRANVAALISLKHEKRGPVFRRSDEVDSEEQTLRRLFGLGYHELESHHVTLIEGLKKAVEKGNVQDRTTATLTLLKLCKAWVIRDHLNKTGLLNVFINQLKDKRSALLGAYALTTCLRYRDVKRSLKDNSLLPKHIVEMLRKDYFDDAVGQVEGFQIFRDFMQHDELRDKIKIFNITEVLNRKLERGDRKQIRTSLICLDIFLSVDPNGLWTKELVENSLKHLKNQTWKKQKAGVTVLSALAQTKHGVKAISDSISDIFKMLLPDDYQPLMREQTTTNLVSQAISSPPGARSEPSSWMMGPACVLWILACNKDLRECMRKTPEYSDVKQFHLKGMLINKRDTPPWRIKTPNRTDVTHMLDKVIEAVDEETSQDILSIEDAALPNISHWGRFAGLLRDGAVTLLVPVVIGAAVVGAPIYLSGRAIVSVAKVCKRVWSEHQDNHILDSLRNEDADDANSDSNPGSPWMYRLMHAQDIHVDEEGTRGTSYD